MEKVVWITGAGMVVCLLLLVLATAYFLREWKKIDHILEHARSKDMDWIGKNDIQESRESRVVSQLMRILNSAQFREQRAAEERDQMMELISDLSHQLKTPLANIVMNMELLLGGSLTEAQQREFLEHTQGQARKMQWLMNSLLKASKLENGMIQFRAEPTKMKGTIAKAVSAVYAQARAKQISVDMEAFEDFDLYHNPKWTAEAIANILENAVKYSPKGSRIRITVHRMELYTRISVSDEGPGIPENEYQLIFRRFYRGGAVEQQEGSGLGLYLAQLILQQEKGYITVSSRLGEGSSFHVFLLNGNVTV